MDSKQLIAALMVLGFYYNDTGFCGCMNNNEHGDNGWQYGNDYFTTDNKIIWIHECQYCDSLTVHCTDNEE